MQKTKEQALEIVQEKIKGMQGMLESSIIKTDADLKGVSDKVKNIKILKKVIEDEKEKFTAPAKQIISEAREKYDPYIRECQNAEATLKQRAGIYIEAREVKALAQEQKIADKVESGQITTEKAIEKIENIKQAPKNVDTGESKMQMRKVRVAVIIEDQENMMEEIFNLGIERTRKLEPINEYAEKIVKNIIPIQYWEINETRVRKEALARDKAGLPQIPGVIIEERSSIASL